MALNLQLHKQAAIIMLLLAGLACGLSFIGWAYSLYEKPLKQEILRAAGGDEAYECLKSAAVKRGEAQRKAFHDGEKVQRLSTQLTRASTALVIVTFGMFYLWSCLVVRIISGKSNKPVRVDEALPTSQP